MRPGLGIAGLALLAGALAWLAAAAQRPTREVAAGELVRELVPAEVQRAATVAALSLVFAPGPDGAGGRELVFLRSGGTWRCRQAFGAIGHEDRLQALFRAVVDAQGVVRAAAPADPAAWGLGPAATVVRAHGTDVLADPEGDVVLAVALGAPAGPGRSFARRVALRGRTVDAAAVWEIDARPTDLVVPSAVAALPPLLDERVLAGPWPEAARGFRSIFVDWADGRSLEVAGRAAPGTGDLEGWVVVDASGAETPALPYRVGGFTAFCLRCPYQGVGDPRRRAEFGLDPPAARVVLAPPAGDPTEIFLSAPEPLTGAVYAWVSRTRMLVQLEAELAALFLPDAAMLTDPERANPWERWLR